MYASEAGKEQTLRRRVFQGLLPMDGHGLDVGAGRADNMPVGHRWWVQFPTMSCRQWDTADGDATTLTGVPDGQFDWLLASHILEHLKEPELALKNWLRVVKPGGHVLISVPHRTLYEGKERLPSVWNTNHLRFYIPDESDNADTEGLLYWLELYEHMWGYEITRLVTGDWGNAPARPGYRHASGEYCIDALLRKL